MLEEEKSQLTQREGEEGDGSKSNEDRKRNSC